MKESRKEFIKEAHKNACSEWRLKIEKEFPKLFIKDELEVGKWYQNTYGGIAFFQGKEVETYGLNSKGSWHLNNGWFQEVDNEVLATEEEVFEALKKEAIKRGFKKGATVDFGNGYVRNLETNNFYLESELDGYYLCLRDTQDGGDIVFRKGKWGEVVETITKEEAEKQLGKTIID